MRQLTALLLIAFPLLAPSAEMWRWKDANGVVHYSDRPVEGAERIEVRPSTMTGSVATQASAPVASAQPAAAVAYTRCAITAPTNDQVFNAVTSVAATLELEPALQGEHRVQVILNGREYTEWPSGTLSYTLVDLYRGSYAMSVRVLDADGKQLCRGESITFHVRQPSVQAPARRAR
jgi:hypothetical protein